MSNDVMRVVTDKVRLSYVHLFSPYSPNPKQEEKYSAVILVPKTDVATMQRINVAIAAAKEKGIKDTWKTNPPVIAIPIYDGDGVKPNDGMPYPAECKGNWVFTASAKAEYKPQIVDAQLNPIIVQSEVYSGCYARVSLNFYPYEFTGKKGIGIGLGNVQKIAEGTPLAGGRDAVSDFGTADNTGYQQTGVPTQGFQNSAPVNGYQQTYVAPVATPNPQQAVNPLTGEPINTNTAPAIAINPLTGLPM